MTNNEESDWLREKREDIARFDKEIAAMETDPEFVKARDKAQAELHDAKAASDVANKRYQNAEQDFIEKNRFYINDPEDTNRYNQQIHPDLIAALEKEVGVTAEESNYFRPRNSNGLLYTYGQHRTPIHAAARKVIEMAIDNDETLKKLRNKRMELSQLRRRAEWDLTRIEQPLTNLKRQRKWVVQAIERETMREAEEKVKALRRKENAASRKAERERIKREGESAADVRLKRYRKAERILKKIVKKEQTFNWPPS